MRTRPVVFEPSNQLRRRDARSNQMGAAAMQEPEEIPAGAIDTLDAGHVEVERATAPHRIRGTSHWWQYQG